MPEELTLVVNSEQVDVLAPPTEIKLTVGVGSPGIRGSKIWAGNPDPISFFAALGERPIVGDIYISTGTQKAHQLVATPAGSSWSLLFDMVTLSTQSIVDAISGLSTQLEATPKWWKGTQAAYNAIVVKDPNTLYVII